MTCVTTIHPALPTEDPADLGREITLLAGQINAANHRLLKLIARFDTSKGWSGGGTVRSCAHWLNWRCGINLGAAREKVRVAHCLGSLPLIDAAFAAGEISYSKVRAMTRVATPETEDYLMMIARHGTASHLEQVVNKYRRVLCARAQEQEAAQQSARELVYYQDEQGMWVLHAKLPPEAGAMVVKAIEAAVAQEADDPLAHVSAETPVVEPALVEDDAARPALPQCRADALEQLAEHFLAAADGPAALKGAERCQVQLHVSLATLRGALAPGDALGQPCHLEHGQGISPATARRLCCDASLVTVLENGEGKVLNIGRRSRTVPPAIRRALALRDQTCRVPGCCERRYVDAHHIVHWVDGGETSLDNLVTLCRHHHRALHNGDFSLRAEGAGPERRFIFTGKGGQVLEESLFPQFEHVSAETSALSVLHEGKQITPQTCVPLWQGERCDYGMAVEGLLRREAQGQVVIRPCIAAIKSQPHAARHRR